jgi:6-phosphogluconolactonase
MYAYVAAAEDGDICIYRLAPGGELQPGGRVKVGQPVMPMAVSPDKRFLVAAARTQPYCAVTYAIDRSSGALREVGRGPLAESFPYIAFDRAGRFLLGASYSANLVSVNPVGADGVVGAPLQVIPTARNAHAIIIDRTNRYVFVPHLGTDQVFQFLFDAKSGRLAANTPPLAQLKAGTGPRHLVASPDNRFVYLLNELTATVSTLALDGATGLLTEVGSASALPPDSKLVPGAPRAPVVPGVPTRDLATDIWASDLHLTPDGRFLYAAERTSSSIGAFRVDAASGRLAYFASTPTEKQPRGFAIDPSGRTMVVSGEKSDMLASYAIDPASGALKPVGRYPTGKGSNWVEIVGFD